MPSYLTIDITKKMCGTCRWWDGSRTISLRNNTPKFISAEAGTFKCLAKPNNGKKGNDQCPAWQVWEKLI